MANIADACGLIKGSIYYHFKSKNELYREVLEYSINEIADSLDKVKLDINKKNNLFTN